MNKQGILLFHHNQCLDFTGQALHMFERLEDDQGISICYENLGDTYMQMGELRQATQFFGYASCVLLCLFSDQQPSRLGRVVGMFILTDSGLTRCGQAIFSYDRCLPIKVETWDKV